MKKITFLLLLLSLSNSINSQITISASDNVFVIGDNIQYNELDISGPLDVGASGANVVWDFTSQTENGLTTIFNYIDPTGLPYIEEMPSPDLASMKDNDTYFYFDTQGGTAWKQSGLYSLTSYSSDYYMFYQDVNEVPTSLEEISYPITYGASNTQDYNAYGTIVGENTEYIYSNAVYSYVVDGWGELQLPHHTYLDALRVQYTIEYNLLIIEDWCGVYYDHFILGYRWYVPEVKGAVFSYYHFNSGASNNYYANWHIDGTSGIDDQLSMSAVELFPNPSYGVINIRSDNMFTILITDISGNNIFQSKDTSNDIQIDLTNQNTGVYFAKIVQDNKVITKKIILK